VNVLVTAYAPNSLYSEALGARVLSRGINGGVRTASGLYISEAIVACGPRFFKWFVIIDNVWYLCGDRGGAITNDRIDLAYVIGSNDERVLKAKRWGVRRRRVVFIKPVRWQGVQSIRAIRPVYKRCIVWC
jgi:3D (Asp-Asp-Asp) domain-containing protein